MAKRVIEKTDETGNCIFRIDRGTKSGTYYVKQGSYQRDLVPEIELEGFDTLPTGLWRDGKGFTKGGLRVLKAVAEEIDNPKARLSTRRPSAIRGRTVTINHKDLKRIGATVRRIDSERAAETRGEILSFLAEVFPTHFDAEEAKSSYRPGQIAALLKDERIVGQMSDADKEALFELYPALVQNQDFTLRSSARLRFIMEGMGATKTVYLEKVIHAFECRLSKKSHEHVWQTFLREHILMMLNTYAAVIEKPNVAIAVKYPDFMLVDAYGYVDIYEIKTPQTDVLKYDDGRDNYYWSPEAARAISQTEKYLDHVSKNRLAIAEDLKRKKGTEVNLVRPRGFVVVGTRKQLVNQTMKDDFRILNDSLKNIDILFFDDLLDNVRLLHQRLKAGDDHTEEKA